MSTRTKGAKAEREYEEILQDAGYITQRVKGSSIFNTNVDFFGLWDIIGFHPKLKKWILVQVKCNQGRGFQKIGAKWMNENNPPHCQCYLAIRYDNKTITTRWKNIQITALSDKK